MHLKWQEVAFALGVVLALLIGKHVPFVDKLPLARVTGILCFLYAIFLSLRLLRTDEAVFTGQWSELRPSLAEKIAALVLGGVAAILVYAMLFIDDTHTIHEQFAFRATLVALFALGGIALGVRSFLVRVRWNHQHIEHKDTFGKRTTIPWDQVSGVKTHWHGVTIHTADGGKVRFSAYQSGAQQLAQRAEQTARRNASAAEKREAQSS